MAFRLVKAQAGGENPYEPSLEYVSVSNITSVHGRHAVFHCPYEKSSNYASSWMKKRPHRTPLLIGRQSEKFAQSDRYVILHKEGVNDLTIFNVTEADEGDYLCQINTQPMRNYLFVLNVMRSPEIVKNSPFDGRAYVEEEHSVQLSCSASGNPAPSLKWRRSDGKKMRFLTGSGDVKERKEFTGPVLTLVNVRKKDSGDVFCIAENGYPPSVSQKFEVTVHYKPRISMHLDEFKQSYGGFVKLMCRIDAVPLPTKLEMRVDGNLMNARQEVISDRIVELHYERSLDFGKVVRCMAENSAGSEVKQDTVPTIKLVSTPPPSEQMTALETNGGQTRVADVVDAGFDGDEARNYYNHQSSVATTGDQHRKAPQLSWPASSAGAIAYQNIFVINHIIVMLNL